MGGIVRTDRVVEDRNRVTGGGVTAGIDFALKVAAGWRAKQPRGVIQLLIEYDPKPPFDSGSPEHAGAATVNEVLDRRKDIIAEAEADCKSRRCNHEALNGN